MKIPYQLVSTAAILKDYMEVPYINSEHEDLANIAEYLYNADDNILSLDTPEFEGVVADYGMDYFIDVINDMLLIDSSLQSREQLIDLIDEYLNEIDIKSYDPNYGLPDTILADTEFDDMYRYPYYEPMSDDELASLKEDLESIPGCDSVRLHTSDMKSFGQLIILVGFDDIPVGNDMYYTRRKKLLNSAIKIAEDYGLTRTDDPIEDQGASFYIIFDTNKPRIR